MDSLKMLKIARNGYIAISLIFCAMGLFLVCKPGCSAVIFCTIIGLLFIADGIIKMIGYFSKDFYCLAFQFDFAFGILSILLGFVFIVHPEHIISILPIVMGIFVLVDGVLKIQTALDAKTFGLTTWWMIILLAVATCICGLLLIFKPFESAVAMMVLLGITLLIDGIQNLWVGIYTVKVSGRNVIDVDYKEL